MIQNSSDESDDSEGDERCFKRDVLNAVERNNYKELYRLLNTDKFDIKSVINTRDTTNKNNTLLHVALKKRKRNLDISNNKRIIELLVEKGANLNILNDVGETPSYIASKRLKTDSESIKWITNLLPFSQPSSSSEVKINKYHPNLQNNSNEDTTSTKKDHELLMDYEEIFPKGNPTYQASGLKYSLHGVIYQLQLLMLFLHRATKVYDSFFLATEMCQAEKFDDVVLKYKISDKEQKWTWRFLQAKHIMNISKNRIQKSQIFSLNDKLPFSLHKYFISFCKIRQDRFFKNAYLEDFLLCTNAELDHSANIYFKEYKCSKTDKILYSKNYTFKIYRLHNIAISKIVKNYQAKFKRIPDSECIKEFLEKFRIITNFPNENQLGRLIVKELGHKYGLLNAELASNTLKSHVLKWLLSYKNGKSGYLLIKDGQEFLVSIEKQIRTLMTSGLSLEYPEELKNYNVNFQHTSKTIQEFLNNKNIQILNLVSESTLLSSIKLAQTLNSNINYQIRDSYIFIKVKKLLMRNVRELVCESFSSPTSHNLLAIDFELNEKCAEQTLTNLYSDLIKVVSDNPFKKVITISFKNDEVKKINSFCSGLTCLPIKVTHSFKDLEVISQQNILKKKVFFQGKSIALNQIININSAHALFDENILTRFLKNEDIRIGKSTSYLDEKTLYLPRTLSRRKIQSNVLADKNFISFNVVFLTGADEMDFTALNITEDSVIVFKDNENYKNRIIFPPKNTTGQKNYGIFKQLCDRYQDRNIYWLEYSNGQLSWENFYGSKIDLKKYFDDNTCVDYIDEENLLHFKAPNKKIFILQGEPGQGKSTFSNNLVCNLKKANPLLWIIHINLNEHGNRRSGYKSLADISFPEQDTEKAIQFMLDIVFPVSLYKTETYFQRKLLHLSLQWLDVKYKYPKVVMIFDGFDEISPTYKEKTLLLLKALLSVNILHLWVTTRTHETHSLEQKLTSPALKLNSFSEEQKIKFINHIFKESNYLPYNYLNSNILDSVCKYLEKIKLNSEEKDSSKQNFLVRYNTPTMEERFKNALRTDFSNNPLHLRMLAEVMSKNKDHLFENIDLLSLYVEFINTKFGIYYEEKNLLDGLICANEIRQRDLQTLRKIHQKVALKELFPELIDKQDLDIDIDALVRVGLVVVYHSGIRFIHRSFAEYFLSTFLEENFQNPNAQHILNHFILHGSTFSIVRHFLDKNINFVLKLKSENHDILTVSSRKELDEWLLSIMIEEKNKNILKSLLIHAKINSCNILKKLKITLYDLTLFNLTEIRRKLLILINVILIDIEVFCLLFHDIVICKNISKQFCRAECLFHIWSIYYSGSNSLEILNRIYEATLENTACNQKSTSVVYLKHMSNLFRKCSCGESLLHKAAARGRFDLIQDLVLWIKQKTSPFLKHNLTENINTSQIYEYNGTENISNGNIIIYNLLFIETRNKETFLHKLVYNDRLNLFIEYLFQNFSSQILKRLILQTDFWGNTFLHHHSVLLKSCTPLGTFLVALKNNFDVKTISDMLLKVNSFGKTVLHLAKISEEYGESFRLLLNFAMSSLTPKIFLELLSSPDDDKKTILYTVVSYDLALKDLFYFLNQNYDNDIIETLIFHIDIIRQTILHTAVKNFISNDALAQLMDFIEINFGKERLKEIIFKTDINGETVLHSACSSNGKALNMLLNFIKNKFDSKTVKLLMVKTDDNGNTCLHYSVQTVFECAITSVLDFVKINFDATFINDLIFATTWDGQTVLHLGASNNIQCLLLQTLLTFLKEYCQVQKIFRNLLLKKDKFGFTPLDKASQNSSLTYFKTAYTCFFNKLSGNYRNAEETKKRFTLTRLETDLLFNQIETLFFSDDIKEHIYKILDEYLVLVDK